MFTFTMTPRRDWSEAGLTAYLSQEREDPLEGIQTLLSELRELAETDLQEAICREMTLQGVCRLRATAEKFRLVADPALRGTRNIALEEEDKVWELGRELERRQRALRPPVKTVRVGLKRERLQEELRRIDAGMAREASNVSEVNAFRIFLRHELITQEEFERARDRPGNTLWNYSGQG
jgi:hypothetical protein